MSNQLKEIFLSVEFWKITAPAIVAVLAWALNEKSKRKWEKWKIKKAACLKALNIANAILSNYEYENLKKGDISPQYVKIEEVRACFNELACTCDRPEVIDELKKIMFNHVSIDAIVDLRNAVRKELDFSKRVVDSDRKRAFVGRIKADPNQT